MGTTPTLHLPYPETNEPADVPTDIHELATASEAAILARSLATTPIGALLMWVTPTPPTDWLLCQGQTNIPVASYPVLAAILGSTGGFIIMPDLRGRFPLGVGTALPAVAGGTAHTLAQKSGEESHVLTPAQTAVKGHGHPLNGQVNSQALNTNPETQDHSHGYNDRSGEGGAGVGPVATGSGATFFPNLHHTHGAAFTGSGGRSANHTHSIPAHTHTDSFAVGSLADGASGAAHENMPPYFALNFMIRAA